jgi:hypothetical protein
MKRKKFERDYSNLSSDEATQKELEKNFHFWHLKTDEEKARGLKEFDDSSRFRGKVYRKIK